MAGYVTAQAQPLPSSGSSDLWLFVSDATAGTTFAEDTGLTINSIVGTTFAAGGATPPNAVLSTAITGNINLAASNALSSYLTAAGSHTLQWAVEAVQFPGDTNHLNPGKVVGITDNLASQATNTSNMQMANLQLWGGGFNQDIAYLAPTQGAPGNGKSYAFSDGSNVGQVWNPATIGNFAGSADLYGQGPLTGGVGLGQSVNLYALTGNGGTGQVQSYLLSTAFTLTQAGTLTTQSAVPLPAAVWLFGSGLLGLLGVGRRRAAAA
jgi:hypothetical protein